jgi:hypothetical protein
MTDRDVFRVEITQRQHEAEAALVRGDPDTSTTQKPFLPWPVAWTIRPSNELGRGVR